MSCHYVRPKHRNPTSDITDLEPSFQIVRSNGARFVLVVDVQPNRNHQDVNNNNILFLSYRHAAVFVIICRRIRNEMTGSTTPFELGSSTTLLKGIN